MTASILTTLSGTVAAVIAQVKSIFGGLITSEEIETVAIDLIPRSFEGVILTAFAHASAILETAITRLTPVEAISSAVDPFVTLLSSVKGVIDAAVAQVAGSACLKTLPQIVALTTAYFGSVGTAAVTATTTAPTRAVMAKSELALTTANVMSKYLPPADPTPDDGSNSSDNSADPNAPHAVGADAL